jgi:hypothetical protein
VTTVSADAIDPATFTRLTEIDAYAKRVGCDRAEAIRQLVNTSLSLLCWGCNVDPGDYFSTGPRGALFGLCSSCRKQDAWKLTQ